MDADGARWDARHRTATMPAPAPPDAIVEAGLVDAMPAKGRALDVACGLGAVSRWFAARGLD
ncbi:MAG: SAM-dependent methyltransferase, partial [Actinomycetota bacterium]